MDRADFYKKSKPTVKNKDLEPIINFISNIDLKLLLACIIGFLLSRVTLLNMMSSASIAYLSLFAFTGVGYYGVLISVILGMVTISSQTEIFKYLLAITIITMFNFFGNKKDKLSMQAVCGSVSILLAGLAKSIIYGVTFYFILMAILESILVFTLVFVFNKAVNKIMNNTTKKYFSNEELISIAILLGGALVGIGNIHINNLYIRDSVVIFMVMLIGYRAGAVAGTSAGMTLGLFMLLSNNFNPQQVVIISGAGLICGIMQELGKLGSSFGFAVGGTLLSIYLNKEIIDNRLVAASICACIVFLLIPNKAYDQIKTVVDFNEGSDNKKYILEMQQLISYKLKAFSTAFKKLSDTFDNLSEKRTSLSQKEVSSLFDDVAAKVCVKCGMDTYCWEDCFYNTYQTMFSILAAAEKKGSISQEDIPLDFKSKCVKLNEFVITTNRMFELYKNNLAWYNKIIESRKLISEQLESVSNVINNLSNDIKSELDFKDDLAKSIKAELEKNKIAVDKLIVVQNKNGKYEINMDIKPCYGRRNCTREIIPIVNKFLDRKMKSNELGCNILKEDKLCSLKLIEEQKFKVVSGVAKLTKDDCKVSGDNYSFMEITNSQYLMALSDGMGSGIKANEESTASIELLEEFLDSGFDKDIAVKLINSVLVLKSNEEIFSTLDICVIDMYAGIAEFVKIGAVSTFIKRGSSVEVIRSTSLPVGILDRVDMETTKRRIKDNDLIIMITDGILDTLEPTSSKDLWLEKVLREFKSNNPQDVADYILQEAKNNTDGSVQDDMTVLVVKVYEKR